MRIAFLGNFTPRTALGEPFSTESHVAASYELLGHTVLRLQEDETPKASISARCQAFGADLLHWVDTWHSDYSGGFQMLADLRRLGIPTVGHTLDLFVGLPREALLDVDPWFKTDWFFSADGGHDEVFRAKGINHHWLPPAVYGPECYLAQPDPALVQDVIFVGSYTYHPQWEYRRHLIDWLRATYGARFTLYDHNSGMRGHRLNQLYASASVVIGDSCCPGFTQTHYVSDRFFETPGRGGLLIHPKIEGIDMAHLPTYQFGQFDQLRRVIDGYLADAQARDHLRLVGHCYTSANHTYAHRVQTILDTVAKGRP